MIAKIHLFLKNIDPLSEKHLVYFFILFFYNFIDIMNLDVFATPMGKTQTNNMYSTMVPNSTFLKRG